MQFHTDRKVKCGQDSTEVKTCYWGVWQVTCELAEMLLVCLAGKVWAGGDVSCIWREKCGLEKMLLVCLAGKV